MTFNDVKKRFAKQETVHCY